jgi:hypothetical protein
MRDLSYPRSCWAGQLPKMEHVTRRDSGHHRPLAIVASVVPATDRVSSACTADLCGVIQMRGAVLNAGCGIVNREATP